MHAVTELETFVEVVRQGGFSAAARHLGLAPSVVAERIKVLEKRLGVQLLMRSTRSQSLTEPGEAYFNDASRILVDLKSLESRVVEHAGIIGGALRVAAPFPLGIRIVAPYLGEFRQRFPGVSAHLALDDQFTDIVADGIDVAIRGAPALDSTFVGYRLFASRRVIVASPAYLARQGMPRTPDELDGHACLVFNAQHRSRVEWRFGRGAAARKVPVKAALGSSCSTLPVDWALAGVGLTQKSWWEVAPHIAAGRLVTVLDAFEPDPAVFYAISPVGRAKRRMVGAFVDGLIAAFGRIDGGLEAPTCGPHARRPDDIHATHVQAAADRDNLPPQP